MSLLCIFGKIGVDVFEKIPLFCIPNFGPKRPFFGPEGPILTQNLKNIVKLVVITQSHAFQGKKWSLSDYVIFGVCRPPNPTPLPPQTPPMVPGGQKWPKCTCTSPVLIINDKKTIFGRVNILTHFFTRNVPWMEPSSIESFGFSRIVIVSSGQFMCRHGEHDVDKGRYLIGWFNCHLWWLRGVTSCLI